MSLRFIKKFFIVAALYDGLLGLVFLFWFKQVYTRFGVTLPNHDGYVQFAALLLVIFGVAFWFVSRDPQRNRDIVWLGVLLKLSYCGVVFWYALLDRIPAIWLPFAWMDLGFLCMFVWTLRTLKRMPA